MGHTIAKRDLQGRQIMNTFAKTSVCWFLSKVTLEMWPGWLYITLMDSLTSFQFGERGLFGQIGRNTDKQTDRQIYIHTCKYTWGRENTFWLEAYAWFLGFLRNLGTQKFFCRLYFSIKITKSWEQLESEEKNPTCTNAKAESQATSDSPATAPLLCKPQHPLSKPSREGLVGKDTLDGKQSNHTAHIISHPSVKPFSATQGFLREHLYLFGLGIFENRTHTINHWKHLSEKRHKNQFSHPGPHSNGRTPWTTKITPEIKQKGM